jgi:KDO2-lipid IV(A) lauroyltransferase
MRNGLFEEINYRIIKGCVGLLSRMSDRRIAAWAGRIGNLWYRMDKRHRTVAVENLAIAYGDDLDAEGRRRQVKSNFTQLARTLLEMPSLMNLNKHNLHRYVFIRGCEHIRSAIQSGKAVVFLTAHMGNWELMALAISLAFDMRVNIVVRPLDSPAANRVLRDIRTRTGNRLIDKYNSMNEISRLLREKKPVGILLDQNASWYEGVYVPFFGHKACTNKGLALLALRYHALIIPVFNHRLPDGRCQIIVEPPLNLRRSGRVTDDVIANTALFNRVIEKHIRSAPDNWFWVHQRWRMKNVPIDTLRRIGHLPLIRV